MNRHSSYSSAFMHMASVYIKDGIELKNRTDKTINMKTIRAMVKGYEDIVIEINKDVYIFTTDDKVQIIKDLYNYKLFAQHLIFYTKERIAVAPPHVVTLMLHTVAEFLFSELLDKKPLSLDDYNNLCDHIFVDRVLELHDTTDNYTIKLYDSNEL